MALRVSRLKTAGRNIKPAPDRLKKKLNSNSWRSGKTTAERGYDHRWQKARRAFLINNPLCRYCQEVDRVTAATVVDHVTPHRGDMNLFWDESNWQPLCAPCHSGRKQREESEAGYR